MKLEMDGAKQARDEAEKAIKVAEGKLKGYTDKICKLQAKLSYKNKKLDH